MPKHVASKVPDKDHYVIINFTTAMGATSFPGSLSEKRETLVAAGHVPPRIWVVTKNSLKGGRLRLLLSIVSLQESVKCWHQNKHFFHVAPVCCITVMSQCNTVQTPKKIYQSIVFVVRWTKFC